MDKVSYKEITICFLVVIAFFLSVSVGYLSHRTDKLEMKIDCIGNQK